MRVEISEPRAVGPTTRFGTFSAVPGGDLPTHATTRGGLLLRDGRSNAERIVVDGSLLEERPAVEVGQSFDAPLVGVLDYAFSNYRLVATERIEPGDRWPEPSPDSRSGGVDRLTLASYNVENLDAGDSEEKFERVARSIVERLRSPDLVALQEIQDDTGTLDDGTVSAERTMGRLIETIRTAGGPTYAFTQIDPENNADGGAPGGNIRVALLFNPLRLALAEDPDPLLPTNPARLSVNSPAFLEDEETGFEATRKPLAAELLFGDKRILVVNVHLKSKRGDDAIFGSRQPPERATERQRLAQTGDIGRKLEAVLDSEPEALIVLLGDFNEHEFRKPMRELERYGLVNLIPDAPKTERYTYNYEGNSQVLDHILVSPALARHDPAIEIVHVNADYPASERASDHDPVLARFTFEFE
jgi:predicted extracellular nuclease